MQTTEIKAPQTELFSRAYSQFQGVDFSTDRTQVSMTRSPDAINMISDTAGFPEKRTGWRYLRTGTSNINNLFYAVFADGTSGIYLHRADDLYKVTMPSEATLTSTNLGAAIVQNALADAPSIAFPFNGKVYILDGTKYKVLTHDSSGYNLKNVEDDEPYIPTCRIAVTGNEVTQIGSSNQWFGGHTYEEYEQPNMLTYQRKVKMTGDGASKKFYLGAEDVDSVDLVTINDTEQDNTKWTLEKETGLIKFNTAPAIHPDGAGLDNIVVTYTCRPKIRDEHTYTGDGSTTIFDTGEGCEDLVRVEVDGTKKAYSTDYLFDQSTKKVTFNTAPANGKKVRIVWYKIDEDKEKERINTCTIADTFGYFNDNRFFFSGIPDNKYWNLDYMSGSGDPTYIPYDGYVRVGADTSRIMGYLKQYDAHLIVKADNEQDAQIFARMAEDHGNGVYVFPVKQGVKGVGAISRNCFDVMRDDPLFLSDEGVFAITSERVREQRSVQDRSFFVNKRLRQEPNLETACSAVWNGYYILSVNNHAYVADSRQRTGTTDTEDYGYEWYYWQNFPAKRMWVIDNVLYFTSGKDICRMNDDYDKMYKYSDGSFPMMQTSDFTPEQAAEYAALPDNEHKLAWRHKTFAGVAIPAQWTTRADTFDTITNLKNIPKKGCAIIIKPYTRSSIDIGYLTSREGEAIARAGVTADILDFNDIDFERITFNAIDLPQVIPLNKKIKKFNLIQFIIRSNTINEGFGVYGLQVTYTLGRYVK